MRASHRLRARQPLDTLTFHRDRERTGWNSTEAALTPDAIARGGLQLAWESPQFDAVDGYPARLYASPLYVDDLRIASATHRGAFRVVFAATSNGFVYAVNAFANGARPPERFSGARNSGSRASSSPSCSTAFPPEFSPRRSSTGNADACT